MLLSVFYNDYVMNMIADSFEETWPKIVNEKEGYVRITEVVSGKEYGVYAIEIDAEGRILKDGGLEFVSVLKDREVRIIMDRENVRFDA